MEVLKITPRGYCHGAVELGLKPVDATCSDVVRTHELVADLARKGYEVVYIGRKGHPEPEGVMGEAPGRVYLVQEPEDIDALELNGDRIAVTCQTTLSVWDTEDLIGRVQARYPQAEVYNEICRATQERQEAAVEAAKEVDLVIVVGSPRSSNSLRLVEVVKKLGHKPAYLVDRFEEDRKSTRLNSSHVRISYAVFCLKKKNKSHKELLDHRPPHDTPRLIN